MSRVLASRRARLVIVLAVATGAIGFLAIRAAGSSLSYYQTPAEFAQQIDTAGKRWQVGGRVVDGTIVEQNGRPVRFDIAGDHGERMTINYSGTVPDLFGPGAFVVVEGTADGPSTLDASSVVIKHENAFYAATATPSPAATPRPQTANPVAAPAAN
jgi:cytochrome c-type biogenesis protein CcmE